jgi:chromosomal replication initiation ATPase DnaA
LAQQLTLDLGHRTALGRDDFLVTPSNASAVALVDQWPHWPSYCAVIVGAAGSGKTHLAEVWRAMSGAKSIAATALDRGQLDQLIETSGLVIEDVQDNQFDEVALFHVLNLIRQNKSHVMLTAQRWPLRDVNLPDLRTRLNAAPSALIAAPDDALLRGVLVKLFADRQIAVDEALVNYLVSHMPRSLGAAQHIVSLIDAAALEQGAEVTRAFAGKVLATLESDDLP